MTHPPAVGQGFTMMFPDKKSYLIINNQRNLRPIFIL